MAPVLEQPMRFKAFCRAIDFNEDDFYRETFLQHPFQIQNQRIAVKRLKHICNATFYLANKSGFSVMTLRQLSEQSGMSMGGLYAYISSKEELAHFIYSSLNHYCQKQIQAFDIEQDSIASRLNMILRCHLYLSESFTSINDFIYIMIISSFI